MMTPEDYRFSIDVENHSLANFHHALVSRNTIRERKLETHVVLADDKFEKYNPLAYFINDSDALAFAKLVRSHAMLLDEVVRLTALLKDAGIDPTES